jgi:hypothetical protein
MQLTGTASLRASVTTVVKKNIMQTNVDKRRIGNRFRKGQLRWQNATSYPKEMFRYLPEYQYEGSSVGTIPWLGLNSTKI